MHQLLLLSRRIEPIRCNARHGQLRPNPPQCRPDSTSTIKVTIPLVFIGYTTDVSRKAASGARASTARVLPTVALAKIAEWWVGKVKEPQQKQLGDDPLRRSGMRLDATKDYEVWLLRWPPGTRVSPHDHGDSAGAFAVMSGELMELRWNEPIPESRVIGRGDTVTIEQGVVHDVVAMSGPSYSVHVYSPPLKDMSFYDDFGFEVVRQVAVEEPRSTIQRVRAWW